MYPAPFEYRRAGTVAEAVELLRSNPDAKLLAGGHSLLPAMKLRVAQPATLVDVGRIEGLSGIREEGGAFRIGALTCHRDVADSAALQAACPMLAETAAAIGDVQVRNRGTIGGSLAHADPSADYPAAMLALGARITTCGPDGRRTLDAGDFFVDLFTTALGEHEILTGVEVPRAAGGAYLKHRHPASSYAVVGIAARVALDSDGDVAEAAIGVTGATAKPTLAASAAASLVGGAPDEARVAAAAALVPEALGEPLGDHYASGGFRLHLAEVHARAALGIAAARAAA